MLKYQFDSIISQNIFVVPSPVSGQAVMEIFLWKNNENKLSSTEMKCLNITVNNGLSKPISLIADDWQWQAVERNFTLIKTIHLMSIINFWPCWPRVTFFFLTDNRHDYIWCLLYIPFYAFNLAFYFYSDDCGHHLMSTLWARLSYLSPQ